MNALLSICLILFSSHVLAEEIPPPPPLVTLEGEVLETRDASIYTYVHLKTAKGDAWAAVGRSALAKGDRVRIEKAMVLHDFKSPSLKRTFKTIYFGNLAGATADPPAK